MLAKIESGLKRCPRCQTTRSRDEFYLDATQPDGLRGYCKPCLVEKNAEYREHCRALKQKLGADEEHARARADAAAWGARLEAERRLAAQVVEAVQSVAFRTGVVAVRFALGVPVADAARVALLVVPRAPVTPGPWLREPDLTWTVAHMESGELAKLAAEAGVQPGSDWPKVTSWHTHDAWVALFG